MISPSDEKILRAAFPAGLQETVSVVCARWPESSRLRTTTTVSVIWCGAELKIPYRIYCDNTPGEAKLHDDADVLCAALFSRHCDGQVREFCLNQIIGAGRPWVIPYVMILVGEYIVSILEAIHQRFDELDREHVLLFLRENPHYLVSTRSRVASYWDCYYRDSRKDSYVGFKLMDKIEALDRNSP